MDCPVFLIYATGTPDSPFGANTIYSRKSESFYSSGIYLILLLILLPVNPPIKV